MPAYDAIVLGIGGMGSATVFQLARRGLRVLGLERFDLLHEHGSSHGLTRIIRLAYWEHPAYVPLLRRAYELWRELERRSGERLLHHTGSIDAGRPGSPIFEGALESCRIHGLTHEVLDGAGLRRRFPAYRLPKEFRCLYQSEGGFLLPERCIAAHATLAKSYGAELRCRERVLDWEARGDGIRVRTERSSYDAARLVICAGAWAGRLVPELTQLAVPERQVMAWLQPKRPQLFAVGKFPVFNLEVEEGHYYGFPAFTVPGFKLGRYHHRGEIVDPDADRRDPDAADEAILRVCAERFFPDGAGPTLMLKTCLFTNSPDGHFILDRHPAYPQVTIAAGFSGHGFKFCSVIGEALADLAQRGEIRHDLSPFRLSRFARSESPGG